MFDSSDLTDGVAFGFLAFMGVFGVAMAIVLACVAGQLLFRLCGM